VCVRGGDISLQSCYVWAAACDIFIYRSLAWFFLSWLSVPLSISFYFMNLFFETGSHYVVQVGLKLLILLPQLPKHWNYRHTPPCLTPLSILHASSAVEFIFSLPRILLHSLWGPCVWFLWVAEVQSQGPCVKAQGCGLGLGVNIIRKGFGCQGGREFLREPYDVPRSGLTASFVLWGRKVLPLFFSLILLFVKTKIQRPQITQLLEGRAREDTGLRGHRSFGF
jgi:hypothetical protein